MTFRHATPALAAALLLAPPFALAQDEEITSPYGMYTYVKGMRGDEPVPEENLKDSKVEVEEGELELIGPDGEEQFEIKYAVDKEQEDGTMQISMEIVESSVMKEAVGTKAKGLAKHQGDTITLIYDFGDDADYPTSFKPDGPTQHLFVLKKSADSDDDEDKDKDDDDEPEDDDPR